MTSVTFVTAKAYADHLSTIIDDEDVVLLAVRRKFPDYGYSIPKPKKSAKTAIGSVAFRNDGSKKPAAADAWISSEAGDRISRNRIEEGSAKLLSALWCSHPAIMQQLGAVQP